MSEHNHEEKGVTALQSLKDQILPLKYLSVFEVVCCLIVAGIVSVCSVSFSVTKV